MRAIELRRHATRDPEADRLSAEGRALAEEVGSGLPGPYDAAFVSPARRAAETLEAFARTRPLPQADVVAGLLGGSEEDRTPERLAIVVRDLLARVPEGGRGLAVGHHPLIERAVLGLTGTEVPALRECEGILLVQEEDGGIRVEELRLEEG